MPTLAELGQLVKKKYPGSYDSMDDRELASAVQKKHPGSYDNFKDDDYSDPLKGFKVSSPGTPPKVEMKEAPMPGLTKVALEGVVKPANSALKGYNEGVAGGAKMLGNVAKGIENVTGLKRGGLFDEMEQVHRQNAADLEGRGADGIAGALYEAGGRLAPDLAKYTAASAALGPVAGMAAVDAATEADKGIVPALEAGAKGALMGGTMHVSQGASLPYRVGGMATAGGGQAALSGGTPTDIAANAITMGAMAIPGGKGVSPLEARAAVKAGKANLETQARGQAEREWAQTNVADAMGVRPLAEKTVPGTSPGQIKAKAQDIAAQDIVGKPFGKLSKEEAAQVNAALRDKELRKHYEQQATDALPQGDQILPDGSPVPLGPVRPMPKVEQPVAPPPMETPQSQPPLTTERFSLPQLETPGTSPALEYKLIGRKDGGVWVSAIRGGKEVGSAIVSNLGNGAFELNEIRVAKDARRTGVGSSLYSEAAKAIREQGGKLFTSPEMTADGRALVDALDRKGQLGNNGRIAGAYRREIIPTRQQTPQTRLAGQPELVSEGATQTNGAAGAQEVRGVDSRTPTRASSQRGGLTVPNPFTPKQQQNLSPSERHFQEQAAIRDKAKAGADSTFMDRLEKLRQAYRTTFNDTTVAMTDNLAPLDAQAGKGVLKATTKMHNFIDKVYRSSSIATRMIQDAGFENVLKNAENLTYLDQFMIARRAAELEANGFRTGRDRAMDAQAVKDFGNRIAVPATKTEPAMTYAQVADKFTAFNNQLLDMSVKSGVVNADIAAHLKAKYKNYVPIDRVMDAVESAHRGAQGASQIASLSRQTIVQKLVGSERLIDDSIVSSIQRADRVMNQVTRNDAATHLTDSLTQLDPTGTGGLIRKLKQGETGPSDRTIHRYANGVKESYVTTPELAAAAKSLDVKQLGWVIRNVFSPAVRVMKTFTTGLSLPFTAINVGRDIGHTGINQKGGAAAIFSPEIWAETFKVILGKSEVVKNMERGGGGFTSFDLARGQVTPEVELMRAKRGAVDAVKYLGAHPVRSVGALFRAVENGLSRSEQIGRARVWQTAYGRAIKEGYSKADAQIVATVESNNVLANYSRAGSLGRNLNAIIPYFNARIQGIRSLQRGIETDPIGTTSKIAALFTAVMAGAAYNLSDPKRKEIYLDLPPYQRRTMIPIVTPWAKKNSRGGWDGVIMVPLPQGLDSLADVWRKGIESLHGSDPVGFNDIAESLIGAFTPVDPLPVTKNVGANVIAGASSTLIPQLVKPTIQALANKDFFRQQPKEPLSMQDLPAQDRAHPYTSGTAKAVARDVLPKVGIETSPIKVEEFVKDTFGGGGGMVVNLVDRAAMATGAIPEQPIGGQGPIDATVSRLTSGRGGDYDTHYYELRKQAQDIIAHRNIAMLQSNPNFNQLPRETQRKLMRSEVAKARVAIGKVTKNGKLDDAPGPQKVEVMRQFLDRIK